MTCPVKVSLSGGYPDGRTRRRGQEPARASAGRRYIRWFFPPVLPGPLGRMDALASCPQRIRIRIRCPAARYGDAMSAVQGGKGVAARTGIEPVASVVDRLDDAQRRAVAATEGPVLLIAGPGAGKTLTLVRRTLHILTAASLSHTRSCCAPLPRRPLWSFATGSGAQPSKSATREISAASGRGRSTASATSSSTGTGTSRLSATGTRSSTS